MTSAVQVGKLTVGDDQPLVLIAGPCVIEDEDHALRVASILAEIAEKIGAGLIFKASYDKANRTSVLSYRGPGLDAGLRILAKVKEVTGLPVLSDVHEISQVAAAAEVLDVI